MARIGWYLKRARVMTAREILYRIRQQLTLLRLRLLYRFGFGLANCSTAEGPLSFCSGLESRLPRPAIDCIKLRRMGATMLRGEVSVAGGTWTWKNRADIWHHAFDTGRTWPRIFFGNISYREGNSIGDVRQIWEPARLQHLVSLALLAKTRHGDERRQAVRLVAAQLHSWVTQNPPLEGPHYISAMECALRLIAVCHALDLLRDEDPGGCVWSDLTAIVSSHAPLIERRLSLYSSTGNHTVAEAAGLIYAGTLFPELRSSRRWLTKGTSILSEAAESQVLPDGGGVEQAFWYHQFNIHLLRLVKDLLEHHGQETPLAISAAVDRGDCFLSAMACGNSSTPSIGDSDGGYALSPFYTPFEPSDAELRYARTFPDSGYTVVNVCSTPAIKLIFDHGPLGMPPAFGHGHADALSLLLIMNGAAVLLDPGTYTYTGDQEWRRYFRGSRAHNTVTVDDQDQARQESCFLWSRPFHARLVASEIDGKLSGLLVAEHDGYRHIGVHHLRGIAWKQNQWLIVRDSLTGDGTHKLDMYWHVAGNPEWYPDGNFALRVSGGGLFVDIRGGSIQTLRGELEPIAGWQSPAYGTVQPISTVKVSHTGSLPHTFVTLVRWQESVPAEESIEEALEWLKARAQ